MLEKFPHPVETRHGQQNGTALESSNILSMYNADLAKERDANFQIVYCDRRVGQARSNGSRSPLLLYLLIVS